MNVFLIEINVSFCYDASPVSAVRRSRQRLPQTLLFKQTLTNFVQKPGRGRSLEKETCESSGWLEALGIEGENSRSSWNKSTEQLGYKLVMTTAHCSTSPPLSYSVFRAHFTNNVKDLRSCLCWYWQRRGCGKLTNTFYTWLTQDSCIDQNITYVGVWAYAHVHVYFSHGATAPSGPGLPHFRGFKTTLI